MARIVVVGAEASIAQRRLRDALVERMRRDGHDAVPWSRPEEGAARSIREADALVALLDGIPAEAATAVALADALDKPCLGLATKGQAPPLFADLTRLVEADVEDDWWSALPSFYEHIRPFAGRLVRDRIPELVKEAGHDVQFRSLGAQERPRFLKQKIATEAKELLAADLANEKEEVADVLEALEAFILARGFDRDDLRRIKDHKKKQRGGFERAFVVEATGQAGAAPDAPGTPAPDARPTPSPSPPAPLRPASEAPSTGLEPTADAQRGAGHATRHSAQRAAEEPGLGFGVAQRAAQATLDRHPQDAPATHAGAATGDEDVDRAQADGAEGHDGRDASVDDVGRGRDVRATFFEI